MVCCFRGLGFGFLRLWLAAIIIYTQQENLLIKPPGSGRHFLNEASEAKLKLFDPQP